MALIQNSKANTNGHLHEMVFPIETGSAKLRIISYAVPLIWAPNGHPAKQPNGQTAKLPNGQTANRPSCQTAKLPRNYFERSQACWPVRFGLLACCHTGQLAYEHRDARLRGCKTAGGRSCANQIHSTTQSN